METTNNDQSFEPLRKKTSLFSFKGRIGRGEYALFLTAYLLAYSFFILEGSHSSALILFLIVLLLFWVLMAEGVKRCHDLGKPGWWFWIPLYGLWLLFAKGQPIANSYGPSLEPEEIEAIFDSETQAKIDRLLMEWDAPETTDERRWAINEEIESFEPLPPSNLAQAKQ